MTLVIIGIILSILTFIGLGFKYTPIKKVKGKSSYNGVRFDKAKLEWKINLLQLISPLVGIIIIAFGCFSIVPANNVGVIYNPFEGGSQEKTLGEGFVFKTPFETVYKLSTEITEMQFENISVQTKDSQFVTTIMQIQVRIDQELAFEYFRKYGSKNLDEISSIISNTLQKELETISTQYDVMEILGESRDEIVNLALIEIQEELIQDGIVVERIVLVDTDAGDDIEQAIANEAVAKKEVETAEYEKEKAEIEGEAKVITAEKEQEANEILSESLTDEILTQLFINTWNGELPVVYGSDGNILDISSILGGN